ncbi:acetyl-CoA synthetase-like protein [Abortiporus biennis]|nr:acetyl-CoA synthetase-like protein [Abortiporus biennis]
MSTTSASSVLTSSNGITFNSPRQLLEESESLSTPLTLPEIYDWNAENNPEYPLFVYLDDEGGKQTLETIDWKNMARGIHRAARMISTMTQTGIGSSSSPRVVAILAQSDSITYSCTTLGIICSGNTAFPISPRNSPDAIAHLLLKTNTSFLFVGNDPRLRDNAETAIKSVKEQKGDSDTDNAVEFLAMPKFEDMFPLHQLSSEETLEHFPHVNFPLDSAALILHSSGSTAFPKPITSSHRALIQWSLTPFYGVLNLEGVIMSCHSTPPFHGMGLSQIIYAASSGLIMSTFKPSSPPIFPTPDRVFEGTIKTHCQIGMYVPMFLEQWVHDPKKVEYLKSMKSVMYTGGPLSKEIGDKLVTMGVPICSRYGATEVGGISPFIQETPGMDWEYVEIAKNLDYVFEPRDDGTFELIILDGERSQPRVFNTKVHGRDAYATNDLFLPHPTKPHLWKIYGRADDQIMLSTGEKTNPGPLERILQQDPHIQHAVMFGRGKFYNGVLVNPSPVFAFDPNGDDGDILLEKFRNMIWSTVERMNNFAPQHSRIFKEMIIVSSPNKPFTYTAKGTVRKPAVIKEYGREIEALYERVEKIANMEMNGEIQSGMESEIQEWNFDNTLDFVRSVILNILKDTVKDEDDIFQHGCDSLQATWIRLQISAMLRQTKPEVVTRLPTQFVFQAPSILSLTNLILQYVKSSDPHQGEVDLEKHIKDLESTVERLTADIPSRPIQPLKVRRKDEGDIILLTGTTGGLGCNMLAHLSNDPKVTMIYAFNRESANVNLEDRQADAVRMRGLEKEYVPSKTVLVEANLSKPQFGLSVELYDELKNSVTHIIHNAWPVDFNLSLSSFEEAMQGVRGLVDFVLSSPYTDMPRILFVSSIGVFRNPAMPGLAKEEYILDPRVPAGPGYGESKWISERILAIASEKTGMKTTSVRIGQLAGDKNGHWNEKEWFPSLVKSGYFTRCLPDVPGGMITWIPTYDAARILVQMRHSDEPTLHLVNSHPVPWHTVLEAISSKIGFRLVPYDEWLKKLQTTLTESSLPEVEQVKRNPALKLLNFYKQARFGENTDESISPVRLDISKARKEVPELDDVKLDLSIVDKWIMSWRATGFLPDIM